jgi:hypothetical protein
VGWAFNGDLVATYLDGNTIDLQRFAPRTDATIAPVQQTPASEGLSAAASPDGRWVAYTANPTGTSEIWVRSLSAPGPPIRVSPGGGSDPAWAKNGRELYYRQGDKLMAVGVNGGAAFTFTPPAELFTTPMVTGAQAPLYDTTSDGRFVFVAPEETREVPISVILNWSELLRNRAAQ